MILAIDFDGTICEHKFPGIGEPYPDMIRAIKFAKSVGIKLILWSCREGHYLTEAIEWCREFGIEFDSVNENIPEYRNRNFAKRKIYADMYIDDRNMLPKDFPDLIKKSLEETIQSFQKKEEDRIIDRSQK